MQLSYFQSSLFKVVLLVGSIGFGIVQGFGISQVVAQGKDAAYPNRQITLIIPFPPAGATDALGRMLSQKLTQRLGQTIIVDNHPGAGGSIGSNLVARAAPDGYTLLLSTGSTHAVAPSFTKKLPYDTQADFTPIGGVAIAPGLLTITKTLPVKNLKEFIEYARAHPNEINYATSGNGTVMHLNAESLKATARFNMTHIPYKGSALATPDLISGKVHLLFDTTIASLPLVTDGKLMALGVASPKRSPLLPNVPTIAEAGKDYGLGQFETSNWFGLYGPKNLSAEIVNKLNAALNTVLLEKDTRERLALLGAEPIPGSPEKFATMVALDRVRWTKIIQQNQISID
ncbi:MAG: tripartite tricarboxylate transporter substrate binding protein [Burkholderiales bacterium]|nr:tripartite tricarboxylate transporter substrate binding protein [Burkholderiales bacterium]